MILFIAIEYQTQHSGKPTYCNSDRAQVAADVEDVLPVKPIGRHLQHANVVVHFVASVAERLVGGVVAVRKASPARLLVFSPTRAALSRLRRLPCFHGGVESDFDVENGGFVAFMPICHNMLETWQVLVALALAVIVRVLAVLPARVWGRKPAPQPRTSPCNTLVVIGSGLSDPQVLQPSSSLSITACRRAHD